VEFLNIAAGELATMELVKVAKAEVELTKALLMISITTGRSVGIGEAYRKKNPSAAGTPFLAKSGNSGLQLSGVTTGGGGVKVLQENSVNREVAGC
jgi:hypothetical protein